MTFWKESEKVHNTQASKVKSKVNLYSPLLLRVSNGLHVSSVRKGRFLKSAQSKPRSYWIDDRTIPAQI